MLQPVAVGNKTLADYTHICGPELIAEIRELAEPLKGQRVVHISATAFGGGVSEILYTLVPLMRDIGLDCDWQVIYGREEFFNATKLMHNALQGAPQDLSDEQWATWLRYAEINARELTDGWDVALIHDPQPAALYQLVPEKARNWVWRCHIDLSTPNRDTISRLLPYIAEYPESLFHMREYVPQGMNGTVNVVPPAIDPLAPKNMKLSPEDATYIVRSVRHRRGPAAAAARSRASTRGRTRSAWSTSTAPSRQTTRTAARARRARWPATTQRAGTTSSASSPTSAATPTCFILSNLDNVGSIEVNAFQSPRRRDRAEVHPRGLRADRLGGDLEGPPVHRRRRRRHPAADRGRQDRLPGLKRRGMRTALACRFLHDPELGRTLGRRGKEQVRQHFLTPRYLRDDLRIFNGMDER